MTGLRFFPSFLPQPGTVPIHIPRRPLIRQLIITALILVLTASPAYAQALEEMAMPQAAHRAEAHQSRLEVLRDLNGPYVEPPHRQAPVPTSVSASVERWRPLVETYFPADRVTWALKIIQCESNGNPNAKNPHSSARGLMQHMKRYWSERSAAAGWAGASIQNPEASIAVGAWLLAKNGPGSWECKA